MPKHYGKSLLRHLCADVSSHLLPEERTVEAYFDRHPDGGGALVWNAAHSGKYKYSANDFDELIDQIIIERNKRIEYEHD